MNRIEKKFRDLKRANKKAFIAFITAGYPNLATTEKLVREFERAGVDIVELGVPFSDPMADGPVIQEASRHALEKNTHLADILRLVRKLRPRVRLPIALMTYYNPVFCFGEEKFISQALACGVDGVIIPDLPPDEGRAFISRSRKAGLDVICFLSPTSSLPRVKYIASVTRGFIYYVSLTGVTGARKALPADLKNNLALIKRYTSKPVCVGFGVSTAAQVKAVSSIADGVIVGSAIVKKIKENIGKPDLVKNVTGFVSSLIGGR
ncbi:MAG: tryptophan synthase subunit alpha [Candidatus Omnitrophota bacterium]|nr:tryptophan synthase subunit alpha [Candidatus Omnitrophota bacterium]